MKFRIERKLFGEVLKQVATSTGKPLVTRVKISVDSAGVVLTGMNEGGTILAGVWVRPKDGLCEVIEKGVANVDITELVKEVPKLKSDMITISAGDRTLIIQGVEELLEKEILVEDIVLPAEFKADKTLQFSANFDTTAKAILTEFDELPVETPNVILLGKDGKVTIIAQDQMTKYERRFNATEVVNDTELWLDYDYFNTIAKMLKKSDLVELIFNDMAVIAKGTKEWGEVAYMLVGKEKEA